MPESQTFISLGPFGGIVSADDTLFASPTSAREAINLSFERSKKAYATMRGRRLLATIPATYTIYGFYKIKQTSNKDAIYFAIGAHSIGEGSIGPFTLGYFFFSTNTFPIPGVGEVYNSPVDTLGGEVVFQDAGNFTYVATGKYGVGELIKVSADLTYEFAGIDAVGQVYGSNYSPTANAVGTGNLNGTYSYLFTYSNDYQESSQTTMRTDGDGKYYPTPIFISASNQQIRLTNLHKYAGKVKYINVYRASSADASQGTFRYVGRTSNDIPEFLDNLADLDVSGQVIVPRRDAPPNFRTIKYHNSRMFGFGYAGLAVGADPQSGINGLSDLWYSNENEPWGYDSAGQVIPLDRNQGDDGAVALASKGSTLIAFKAKRSYAITGHNQADLVATPAFEMGAFSQNMVVEAYGGIYFMNAQFQIWSYLDGLAYISTDIQDQLTYYGENKKSNISNGCSWVYDRSLYFSLADVTFVYHLDTQQWVKSSMAATEAYSKTYLRDVQCMSAKVDGASQQLSAWLVADSDFNQPILSYYESQITDCGAPEYEKVCTYLLVQAPIQKNIQIIVRVTADPGAEEIAQDFQFNLAQGPTRRLISIPKNFHGFTFKISVKTISTDFAVVEKVILYGMPTNRLVPARALQ